MAKTKISEFSSTPGSNTDIDGINIAEGCAPSGINDAIRELMAQLKDFQTGAAGDSFNGPVGTTTAAAGAFTTLSATGVTTVQAGTSSAPAITTSGDTNTGIFFPAADTIAFTEGGTEAMRIDSSGNVGVGTSSPVSLLHVNKASAVANGITVGNTNGGTIVGVDASGNSTFGNYLSGYSTLFGYYAGGVTTTFTERARIDSSGNLLVGATGRISNERFSAQSSGNAEAALFSSNGTFSTVLVANYYGSGTRNLIQFRISTTDVGNITSAGSTTSYNTTSDYRLKESVQPMQNALAVVQQLKPCTYTWKSTGEQSQGFIAHELQEVVPDCVTGEKDAVDAEGNPVYQGIDTSFLVATLTAALQELKAIVDSQADRIAVLEAK